MSAIRYNIVRAEEAVASMPQRFNFVETSAGSHLPRHAPSLVAGPGVRDFLSIYYQPNRSIPSQGIFLFKDASVIPDGLIVCDNNLIMSPSLMTVPEVFPLPWNAPNFFDRHGDSIGVHLPEQRVHLPGTTVNLISLGWQVFGHMLIDVFPRFERVLRSGMAFDRYLFGRIEADWHVEVLRAAGIPIEKCEFIDINTTIIDCENMLVPTFSRLDSELHSDTQGIHNRLREQYAPTAKPNRDIFISRSSWGRARDLVNRAEIEDIAEQAGFEIISPEKLTFPEQIALFASARTVLGETGSGMHSTLFSQPGTKVGVLQAKSNVNFIQSQIASIGQQEIFLMLGEDESGTMGQGWFSIHPSDAHYLAESLLR